MKENKVVQSKEYKNNKIYIFSEYSKYLSQDEIENSEIYKYIELIKKHMINYEETLKKVHDGRLNKVRKEKTPKKNKKELTNIKTLKERIPKEKPKKISKKINMIAKHDAKIFAEEYFKTFIEEFKNEMFKKIKELE